MLVHGASHVVGATNTQQFQRIESDGAVGDSTGFVKVQAIHTSEVSTDSSSCTSVFLRAKRMAASAKFSEVSSTRPSGIIPTTPATAEMTAERHSPVEIGHIPAANSAYLRPDQQYAERHHQEGHEFQNRVDALV